jgi:hypothetical protein
MSKILDEIRAVRAANSRQIQRLTQAKASLEASRPSLARVQNAHGAAVAHVKAIREGSAEGRAARAARLWGASK